jgi:ribosomal subunit interface protein
LTDRKGFLLMDIIFKGRHTDVLERFRKHATSKLAKMERLDQKVIRVDVEVTAEHNPRQSGRAERVELTITTRGPAIRAEAAAEDRFAALDLALAKLESRLRRSCDRRKDRHGPARPADRPADRSEGADQLPAMTDADFAATRETGFVPMSRAAPDAGQIRAGSDGGGSDDAEADPVEADVSGSDAPGEDKIIAIAMEGDGPLVVREKLHVACPMTIDQALFEMELIGHDFFLFTDTTDGLPSVVYRRRGYQYGVIRLVEDSTAPLPVHGPGLANGHSPQAANLASG